MAMAKFTVDGTNRLLIAKTGVTAVDVKIDLYSDAKEHWITTADAKFPFPFRTVGGDPIGGGKFAGDLYFLTNGWKIRPDEVDHTLAFDGNLYLDDGETGGIIVPTLGDFTVLATIERSADARGIETGSGSSDWTTGERSQIRDALGIDGTKVAATGGQLQSKVNAGGAVSLPASERDAVAAAILDLANAIRPGYSVRRVLRLAGAILLGKVSGSPGAPVFMSLDDLEPAVSFILDSNGNRLSVTHHE